MPVSTTTRKKGPKSWRDKVFEKRGDDLRGCYVAFSGLKALSMTRFKGVKESFKEQGRDFDEENLIFLDNLKDIPEKVIPWIKENGFNTVFAFNDYIAMALLQPMLSRGLKVPEEVSLTGFDNSPILNLVEQKITTVTLSIPDLGRQAGEWLKKAIID